MSLIKRNGNSGTARKPPTWLWILLTLGMLVRLFWLGFAQDRIHRPFWSDDLLLLLLSLLSILLIWYVAASLARYAGLSERGAERFTVMSTLLMVAPPLPILTQQLSSWLTNAISLVLLALLFALQRERQARHSAGICNPPTLRRLHRLTSLPLLCTACIALLYSGSYFLHGFPHPSLSVIITDLFILGWPYTIGAFFTLPYLITQYRHERALHHSEQATNPPTPKTVALHVAMLIIIGIYFIVQLYTYIPLQH
ncbi:hypothetical protein [Dictyobacter formicarum]|uniref:Uncharacterized protein n=1 Tax=Dictyobacter formicarum TaxID=2778368 RepID=A0ABQ3VDD5_9CHLR|nr:hypothetical protein [Dictyobacter formicarum]GHO83932.1 hypothetical protein KSZ_19380 [Dictyobacter formicarum]